jgi:small subunit ribosomal protein S9
MRFIHVSGRRKTAVARATLSPGAGIVRVNAQLLSQYEPLMSRMKIQEPLLIAGDAVKSVNIDVKVHGGGSSSQAEAARLAVARALAQYDQTLQKTFLDYDRALLVADVRYKETHKPNNHGKARATRQKSYR